MAKKISKKVINAVKRYVDVLKKEIRIDKVVLFGSHAKGNPTASSDIDIAVISEDFGKNPHEEGKYLMRKLWEVDFANIEPIPYSPSDFMAENTSALLNEIRKEGIVIYR